MPHRMAQGMSMRVEFMDFDLARFSKQELTESMAHLPTDLTAACRRTLQTHFANSNIPIDQSRATRLNRDIGNYRSLYIQNYCLRTTDFLPNRRSDIQAHIADKKATAAWIMQRFASDSNMYLDAAGLLAEALFVEGGDDNMGQAGGLIQHILNVCKDHLDSPMEFYKKLYDKMSVLWAYFTARHTTIKPA